MSYLAQAEIAGGEILVFELAVERYFGFSDADMSVSGVSADANVTGSTGSSVLASSGIAQMLVDAAGAGSADMSVAGEGVAQFSGVAVQKISADFEMRGVASWMVGGVTFTPHSVLGEDNTVRPPEFRSVRRPCEYRGTRAPATPSTDRTKEHRGVTR